MTLDLPEPPSVNVYYRYGNGRTYMSVAGVAYNLKVMAICRRKKAKPLSGAICVTVHWYRGIKSGDVDNRLKPVLDSLQGHAYTNDKQIIELHAYRHDRKGNPGVTVTIEAAARQRTQLTPQ